MYSGIFPLKLPWEFIPSLRVRYTTFGSIAFSVLKRPCHNLKCKLLDQFTPTVWYNTEKEVIILVGNNFYTCGNFSCLLHLREIRCYICWKFFYYTCGKFYYTCVSDIPAFEGSNNRNLYICLWLQQSCAGRSWHMGGDSASATNAPYRIVGTLKLLLQLDFGWDCEMVGVWLVDNFFCKRTCLLHYIHTLIDTLVIGNLWGSNIIYSS